MAIGEFDGAAALPAASSALQATPMYWLYEMGHAALDPSRAFADATRLFFKNPVNPLAHTTYGKSVAAAMELFERTTRRYGKPDWGIDSTMVGGERVPVHIKTVWERPFCRLLHFERAFKHMPRRPQPKLLIVAPMSGHYATLLRGTVEAFLPNHDVYITDWRDARVVPVAEGRFDLDDYIDYVISMLHMLGGDAHVIAVCQPSVPVLAAVAVMEADDDPYVPHSHGADGRSDRHARQSERGQQARRIARHRLVPPARHHQGAVPASGRHARRLSGLPAALRLHEHESRSPSRGASQPVQHLVKGDGDSAQKHREFYDEYLAVMDLSAEFYLQTVDTVFIRHSLPKGEMTHRGRPVDLHEDQPRRPDDGGRRARRYFRRRPD